MYAAGRDTFVYMKVKPVNLKCMGIMQDNLCHPYILLSTTVLSDRAMHVILVFMSWTFFWGFTVFCDSLANTYHVNTSLPSLLLPSFFFLPTSHPLPLPTHTHTHTHTHCSCSKQRDNLQPLPGDHSPPHPDWQRHHHHTSLPHFWGPREIWRVCTDCCNNNTQVAAVALYHATLVSLCLHVYTAKCLLWLPTLKRKRFPESLWAFRTGEGHALSSRSGSLVIPEWTSTFLQPARVLLSFLESNR